MLETDCKNVNVTMMNLGTVLISRVKECVYLVVKLVAGKGFVTNI